MSWDEDYDFKNHVVLAARDITGSGISLSVLPGSASYVGAVAQIVTFLAELPYFEDARRHVNIQDPRVIRFVIGREIFELRSTIPGLAGGLGGTRYENHRPYRIALFKVRRRMRWWMEPERVYITQFFDPEQWNYAAAGLLRATTLKPQSSPRGPRWYWMRWILGK